MFKFIDLFSGIGGFHIAASRLGGECVFASEIDSFAKKAYLKNFGILPAGDITKVEASNIPDHDILFAGFPCQPFSIIGKGEGFSDTRGTLFFDIERILKEKLPDCFVLENVKRLVSHNNGKTLAVILQKLESLGYFVEYRVLNALDFGLPQKRERIFIVGFRNNVKFLWPKPFDSFVSLDKILEKNVSQKYFVSEHILKKRRSFHSSQHDLAIWHENKSGNISSYPYSCALRAGASYNYLLVNGERRLTPREMLRLQGFPDSFEIVCSDMQTRKQAGNAVPVPMVEAVLRSVLSANTKIKRFEETQHYQPLSSRVFA